MTVAAAHQLNSIYLDTTAFPTTPIGGITRQTINTGIELIKENNSGSLWPEAAWVVRNAPSAALSTTHCEELLDVLGVRGACISGGNGVQLWARRLACAGIADALHQQYTFYNGIIIPMAMTCDHQGNAAIEFVIFGIEAGAVAAMTVTNAESIPAAATVPDTDRWSIYQVAAGGNIFSSTKSIGVSFGNAPILESADGDTAPTFASVMETAPVISVRGIDPVGWWDDSGGLSGVSCTHANTIIWLKKRGVAVGVTNSHMKITMNGTAHTQQAFDASGNATGEQDLIIEGTEDASSNAPLAISFTDAIS